MHTIFTPGLAAEQIRDWRRQAEQAEQVRQARRARHGAATGWRHHATAWRGWWPPPSRRARTAGRVAAEQVTSLPAANLRPSGTAGEQPASGRRAA